MYKLTWCNESDMLKEISYLDRFHFNEMPKPFFEVEEKEFKNYYNIYSPQFTGIGQICRSTDLLMLTPDDDVSMIEAKYYFFVDRGYAVLTYYVREKEAEKYSFKEVIRYFRFGCEHDYTLISNDGITIVRKCNKCGLLLETPTGR